MELTCIKATLLLPPNDGNMTARFLVVTWSLLFIASTTAAEINSPQPKHGLHVTDAVQDLHEVPPLDMGIVGTLIRVAAKS